VTPEEHRRLGVELYNGTWELIERRDRTPDEDDEMLHRAHASAYHWLQAPHTAANRARSHWLCSRVHAIAGQPEGALHHARRCLFLVEKHVVHRVLCSRRRMHRCAPLLRRARRERYRSRAGRDHHDEHKNPDPTHDASVLGLRLIEQLLPAS
jgi:hypothetical protein